ncbi:hypothetical protein [uncultured Maribacter sp.]|uniref:hypothetical protein n=1 Tax=uncultured Maribacter sp. TaxID=431308 RepID=UPI00260DC982|nr:hypothetical protein [uncultured Maribacter sp.]
MKKYITLLSMIFVLFSCSGDWENEPKENNVKFSGEVDWVKNYGGSGEETAQSIIKTFDGGYAVLGFSNSIDGDLEGKTLEVNDYWLLKLDELGNKQWSKTYGGSKDDKGQSVKQTKDGGFVLTGYAMSNDGDGSNNEGFHDNWIVKIDANGTLEWEKSYGFSGHDHSYDILETQDGGFFFVGFLDITLARSDGYTDKSNSLTRHGVGEFWGTKIDALGNIEWRRYFGGTNNDRAHAVVQSNDGGFVMAGFSESTDFDITNSNGGYDFWVLKINSSGELLWQNSFGGSGIEIAYDIAKTTDNAYVITGNTFSTDGDVSINSGESDVWLIKVSDTGELIWEKTFGGASFDAARGVTTDSNGGFIIVGNTKSANPDASLNAGQNDIWLIKTDAQGKLTWQNSFGGVNIDFGFDVVENTDKSIVLVGETLSSDFLTSQSNGKTDVVIIKIK